MNICRFRMLFLTAAAGNPEGELKPGEKLLESPLQAILA